MLKENLKLQDIISPISEDIKLFQKEFDNALYSNVKLINTISNFYGLK